MRPVVQAHEPELMCLRTTIILNIHVHKVILRRSTLSNAIRLSCWTHRIVGHFARVRGVVAAGCIAAQLHMHGNVHNDIFF